MTRATTTPASLDGLVVEGVSKRFGDVEALSEVDLSVRPGEVVALLGNNGAGKSTLMSICAGLVRADSGRVRVLGELVGGRRGGSADLGLAPQEEAVYPTLTVRQNLSYFGRLVGLGRHRLAERVTSVAGRLSILPLLDTKVATLSGGQRRRLHTALALMHEPSVLLLDEVTVGVDVDARAQLLSFVRGLADDGAAVLYTTHQLHEVAALDARVVVIDRGRIVAAGTVDELVERHAHAVAELRFSVEPPTLPGDLGGPSEVHRLDGGAGCLVRVRLADPDVPLSDVVDRLAAPERASLQAAAILAPTLEMAFMRLTREDRR